MDQFVQAALGLLAVVLTAVGRAAYRVAQEYAANLVQERLGVGAARIAGQIAAEVTGRQDLQMASAAMVAAGVAAMQARFPDTAGKLAPGTLEGMILGELGRMGQGVER